MLKKSSLIALTIIFAISVILGVPLFGLWQRHSFAVPRFFSSKSQTENNTENSLSQQNGFFSVPYAQAQAELGPSVESTLNRPLESWEKDFLKCLCGDSRLNWVCCRVYGPLRPE